MAEISEEDATQLAHWRTLRGEALLTAFLDSRWYPMPDDLIGGWCIMPLPHPPSMNIPPIGEFLSQPIAEHVAELHNTRLLGTLTRQAADKDKGLLAKLATHLEEDFGTGLSNEED